MQITIEKYDKKELDGKGVFSWPIWTKENSKFDWYYDQQEECYLLEGRVRITVGTEQYNIGPGDFVTFPKGMSCIWHITEPVKKHYFFGA